MSASRVQPGTPDDASGWSIEAIQSLIVAFVIAMAFRSYVLEGFVIPTGSMAPTLMGAHIRVRSPQTGYEFPIDAQPAAELVARAGKSAGELRLDLSDPMLDPGLPVLREPALALLQRASFGDRVLVLKSLYPFMAPRRWDVVVFKNPTDPIGDAQNYIKRLVGLPDEALLIVDGDVFTGPRDGAVPAMQIERKPDHVQRAVWQPVSDLDWQPLDPQAIDQLAGQPWRGFPWLSPGWTQGEGAGTDDGNRRVLVWPTAAPATLRWDSARRSITDWNAYNMLRGAFVRDDPVSDLRIAATVEIGDSSTFSTQVDLVARGHVFRFALAGGQATLSIQRDGESGVVATATAPCALRGHDRPVELEFWQVDQRLSIHVDGESVVALTYDWGVEERVARSFNGLSLADYAKGPASRRPSAPAVSWRFEGSPVSVRRLRLDRDIYYRQGMLAAQEQFASNGEPIRNQPYFGTDPGAPALIDADHFLMLGDNSAASRDGRAWGRPHPLVQAQIGDETPFLVHRRLLLGRACAVYFPSPLPFSPGGRKLIPDFGRLRFIR